MKKIISVILASMLALPLVSCGEEDEEEEFIGDGGGMMYNVSLLHNPKSLDPQFADDNAALNVMKNLYSGLVSFDDAGNLVCLNAESYDVSDDGITYTFHLRDDNYWFFDTSDDDYIDDDEYFPVTAKDYEFALRRVLNPDMRSPYANYFTCIKGASSALKGNDSSLGVHAEDDSTLVIQLEYPSADFIRLMTTPAAYPCNEDFFNSTKGKYGLDDDSVMSNGAFFVRQWFFDPYGHNNILYMRANTINSTEDCEIQPSFLSYTIEESAADIRNMFREAEIDCFTSLNKSSFEKKKYSVTPKAGITLGLIFNDKDTVCSNRNFRRSIACGTNRNTLSEQTNDDVSAAYGIVPPAVTMLGRSYRDLINDAAYSIFDVEKAVEFNTKAKSDLHVESFGTIRMLVCSGTVDAAYTHLLTREWQDILGFYVSVDEVADDEFYDRIDSGDFQIALYPLQAEYNSGISVFEKLAECSYSKVAGDTKNSVDKLRKIKDSSELVNKISSVEKLILDEYSFIPIFYKNYYLIAERGNKDIVLDPFSCTLDFRIAKHYD